MEPHQCHIDSLKHTKQINTTSNLPKENKDFLIKYFNLSNMKRNQKNSQFIITDMKKLL